MVNDNVQFTGAIPYFNYCSTVWHDNNSSHINNLFKLQKRATRVITSSDYSIRSVQICETLQWQPIKIILDKRELIMMFKVLNGMAPNYLTMLFYINVTDSLKKSFVYRGAAS